MEQRRKTFTPTEASRKMEHYCAYQERCHLEVSEKLKDMNIMPETIDQIITNLIRNDFLNEERFARKFTLGKFHQKKWGRKRIVRELRHRNISKHNIQVALAELNDDDYDKTFHQLAVKRLEQIREHHPLKRKRKLADYLLYRGWEPELVYEKVQELVK